MRVSQLRVTTPEASKTTKRRRVAQLADIRKTISGEDDTEADELDREKMRTLVSDSDFKTKMTTEEALAMKASLSLPWKKLRIMRRYIYTCIYMHIP